MPHPTWRCTSGQSEQSPAFVAQRYNVLFQHAIPKRYKPPRSLTVFCTAPVSAEVNVSVHVGQTPYGRGLLSHEDLPSGKRLLSVPFSQLLLLPDRVDPSFKKIYKRFQREHGQLPVDLLSFIQGNHTIPGNNRRDSRASRP